MIIQKLLITQMKISSSLYLEKEILDARIIEYPFTALYVMILRKVVLQHCLNNGLFEAKNFT